MSSVVKSRRTFSEPPGERGSGLDFKRSSKGQQHSRIVKDEILPTQGKQSLKHHDKLKAKYRVSQPCDDLPHEPRLHANEISVQPKTSGNHQLQSVKINAREDDELVKYMSKLPCYLQRMESSESIQGKALNVGVLDWSRLEEWKGQNCIAASDCNGVSRTSCNLSGNTTVNSVTFSNAVHNGARTFRSKRHPSFSSGLNSSHDDHVSQAAKVTQNASCFSDFEIASRSSVDRQKKLPRSNKSSGRNTDDVIDKRNRKDIDHNITSKAGNWSSNSRYDGIPIRPKVSVSPCDGGAEKRVGEKQEPSVMGKALDKKMTSTVGALSSQSRSHDVSFSLKAKNVTDSKTEEGRGELQQSAIDLSHQHRNGEKKNIVVLVPKKFSMKCSLQEPKAPLDEELADTNQDSWSDGLSHEDAHSSVLSSEIPYSCPLLYRTGTDTEPHRMLHTSTIAQSTDASFDASHSSPCSSKLPIRLSDNKFAEERSGMTASGSVIETSNSVDKETVELMARKGRHPSPNHRFSFSLSRLTRSFSFKESSAVPQLRSTSVSMKSGPVTSKGSCLDKSNREKATGDNRARSSPLRRMLDPLLKSKSSRMLNSGETDAANESFSSFNLKQGDANESLKNEEHKPSSMKALLQLTVTNGVPLFRFVVDNSSNILEATVKALPQKDAGSDYIFYVINEIKKKRGSWINQGSKDRGCGYISSVIGWVKVNSSSIFDLGGRNSICQIKVKESVLLGVDSSQADKASSNFMVNSELAAIVIKMPFEILSLDPQQTDQNDIFTDKSCSQCLTESQCSCSLGKSEHSSTVTVILPGGNHSLPNEGGPSPLILRWRSGGSCDCGGWDIGCKLRIFTSESQCMKIPQRSKDCLMLDCLELFCQGATLQDRPIFSLARVEKGMYSIEFNSSSMSLLQAFFVCVTVTSCQELSDLLDVSNPPNEKVHPVPRNSSIDTKIHPIFPRGTRLKYTLSPPLSPVDRA